MDLPKNILTSAESAVSSLLPSKSSNKYITSYNKFIKWKEEQNVSKNDFSETVLLAYFAFLKGQLKVQIIYCRARNRLDIPKLNLKKKYLNFFRSDSDCLKNDLNLIWTKSDKIWNYLIWSDLSILINFNIRITKK